MTNCPFVALIVKFDVPKVVGNPCSANKPVAPYGSTDNPAGYVPDRSATVTGMLEGNPTALKICEYNVPGWPAGSVDG